MKKLMTLVFAALIAATLSMPAWSQSATGSQQPKAATSKNQSKEDKKTKKQAKGKKKADKDDSKKTDKKK